MKNLWVLLCCFLLPACAGKKTSDADGCQLQATGEVKSFELDSDVRYNAFYLYTFADKEGKQYLSFLNIVPTSSCFTTGRAESSFSR